MLTLYFDNVDPLTCILGQDENKWTDELAFGAFFGNQIFLIDQDSFGGDYPILGFARELNAIAFNLKEFGRGGMYQDPEFENPFYLDFSLQDENALVSLIRRKTKLVVNSKTVQIDELYSKSSAYASEVVQHFSASVPELLSNEKIRAWLTDLTIPGYQNLLGK